jgi:GWxTD domain-containing protein
MKLTKVVCFAALMGLCGALVASGAEKVRLPDRYQKWLEEEVTYIITAKERNVFLQLATDREREAFIEAFWKQRDPTPGTPENEFKTEHYRRLSYANQIYHRGSVKPGWRTDRGRIYIILGEPKNIEDFDTINGVNPVEIWFYQPENSPNLPAAFNVIFYKENGTGEYKLYSPVSDGPEALIADTMRDFRNDYEAYQKLRDLAPTLAPQVMSLIPNEHVRVGATSLASNRLMQSIYESPLKKIDSAYAEALLKYKDSVEVEYTANYMSCEAQAQVFRSDGGPFVVHLSVEPQKLSLDELEGRYSTNFDLNGRLTDEAGRTVYQFDKQFGVSLTKAEVDDVRGTTLALEDMFPCLPGKYAFDLLIKNTVSKEFGTYEVKLEVPALPAAQPVLGAAFLAYGYEPTPAASGEEVPFRVAGSQVLSQAQKRFSRNDTLYVVEQAYSLGETAREGQWRLTYVREGKPVLTRAHRLAEVLKGDTLAEAQPLSGFAPGYYDLTLDLLDAGGRALATRTAHFEISPAASLPRPRILAKVLKPENRAEWDYALGAEAIGLGTLDRGVAFLEKAYAQGRGEPRFGLAYAHGLFLNKDYAKAKDVLLPLTKNETAPPEVFSLLGRTVHALGSFEEAIVYYQEYLTRAGTNLEIMNLVGTCQYQMGDRAAALATWRRSLAINPNQEQIKKLVDSLNK